MHLLSLFEIWKSLPIPNTYRKDYISIKFYNYKLKILILLIKINIHIKLL